MRPQLGARAHGDRLISERCPVQAARLSSQAVKRDRRRIDPVRVDVEAQCATRQLWGSRLKFQGLETFERPGAAGLNAPGVSKWLSISGTERQPSTGVDRS